MITWIDSTGTRGDDRAGEKERFIDSQSAHRTRPYEYQTWLSTHTHTTPLTSLRRPPCRKPHFLTNQIAARLEVTHLFVRIPYEALPQRPRVWPSHIRKHHLTDHPIRLISERLGTIPFLYRCTAQNRVAQDNCHLKLVRPNVRRLKLQQQPRRPCR